MADRFREIYREKALMNGGLSIGGECECPMEGTGKPAKGVRHCVKQKKTAAGKRCKKYADGPKPGVTERKSKKSPAKIAAAKRNPWVKHLKKWAKEHSITYAEAIVDPDARDAYERLKAKVQYV